jgi:hypothetical protein
MKEVMIFSLFVVMALGFWYVQSLGGIPTKELESRGFIKSADVTEEEEITEKTVEVPILVLGIPEGYKVRLFPPTAKVVCRLPLSRYKELAEADVSVSIPFEDLQNAPARDIHISARIPEWVYRALVSPERIEFLIEEP